ncbi:hypothetical protein LAZ40_11775 [Cereibacter sphaeroides]|uniref:hypothetical protein n=1 Tax=Cereibacter sphaeroides TaxID=1063 RepID=UPI001F347918|nr:hypothetical protein [Cereibacter sphaeroides]MCE6959698.1 hypothetical protein [Cereibacter sphaeroides]MCE6974441.1 hypothetical protein [Cereibacter sphaeroides]
MRGFGPHLPERGWETRWLIQAGELAFHAHRAFLVLLATVVLYGAAGCLLVSFVPSIWGFALVSSGLAAFAAIPVLLIHGELMKADGSGDVDCDAALVRGLPLIKATFLVTSIMMATMLAIPSPPHQAAMAPPPDLVEVVLRYGIRAVTSLHVSLVMVNPLCLALVAGMGFSLRESAGASLRMVMRMLPVWASILFGTVLASSLLTRTPPILAVPGLLFLIAWTHVAAREIFGGIRENGVRTASLAPRSA